MNSQFTNIGGGGDPSLLYIDLYLSFAHLDKQLLFVHISSIFVVPPFTRIVYAVKHHTISDDRHGQAEQKFSVAMGDP